MGWGNKSLFKWPWSHDQDGFFYKGWWPWNLVCSIGCSSTTKFVQMMTLGWPWPILRQGQIWSLMLLYRKKVKQWIFQKLLSSWFGTSNRWPKYLLTSQLLPLKVVCPLPWGYIHALNHEKKCIKSNFISNRFLWNLQQMVKVMRPFCWHQNFVPWGLSSSAPGLYTCIKSWKKCIK